MKYNYKNNGTVMLGMILILSLLSQVILYTNKIYNRSFSIDLLQLRQDAHMLSIEALYAETLNQVSWVNKQLKRMALLMATAVIVPELLVLVDKINMLTKGLKYYQEFLLKTLPYKLAYYDKSLSLKNNLKFSLNKELYIVPYKRGLSINLIIVKIPGLIKFNKSIFKKSCIEHTNIFQHSKACIHYKNVSKAKDWFTPTEELWTPLIVS